VVGKVQSNKVVFRSLFSGFLASLLFIPGVNAAAGLMPFPNAQLTQSRLDSQTRIHEVMLGPLKKINNVLNAEKEDRIRGTRKVEIHSILDETRTDVVADFYQQQLDSAGVNLFRCKGRDCGESNDWANAVFKERILYGSSQDQHYFVSQIDSQYFIVYVTRRATGGVYVYSEVLTPDNTTKTSAESILKMLRIEGRFVLPKLVDQALLVEIAKLLKDNRALNLLVVGHEAKPRNSDLAQAVNLSDRRANKLVNDLVELGVANGRLIPKGIGYMAPDNRYPATRIELIVQ